MPHICNRCGYTCNSISKYNKHINRKNPCISEEDNDCNFKCDFCHNGFSTNSNLTRHRERCVVRKNPELLLKYIEKQEKTYNEIIKRKTDKIKQLKRKLKNPNL
jgi:hypothetical protein